LEDNGTLLSGSNQPSLKTLSNIERTRNKISEEDVASFIIDVCEELLVLEDRKYRLALSIDANDVRAVDSWGSALSFRGQLVADTVVRFALFLTSLNYLFQFLC